MSEKLLRISRAIAGFMKYLRQSDMRCSKFTVVAKTPKP